MVSLAEEKEIYKEIQKKLFYIIPEKWESIYLYASIIEIPKKRSTGEMYFYYFPKGIIKRKAINGYEIPNEFNIDEEKYANLVSDLYNKIKYLRQIWIEKRKKRWTNLTISIQNNEFKVEYDYTDLNNSNFDSYERHVIWRYNYLKPDFNLLEKKEKSIIKRYNEMLSEIELPKKDVYIEGIYDKPVKNIVDFEKTLSVEEAIAQSDNSEDKIVKKRKRNLLHRKKMPDDIVEIEDDEVFNNQILNWKQK